MNTINNSAAPHKSQLTGSVALDHLLVRHGIKVGQTMALCGGAGSRSDVRSIAIAWVCATMGRGGSCVFLDLDGGLTDEVVQRAGLRFAAPEKLASAKDIGGVKGFCRVARASTWGQLNEVLDFLLGTATSPTLIVVWGLERLLCNHIDGRATPTNQRRVESILDILRTKHLPKFEASGHTMVFAHAPDKAGDAASKLPKISDTLRDNVRELLSDKCALRLEVAKGKLQGKPGKDRFIKVPIQPWRQGQKFGQEAALELWQKSGRFKNG